SLSVFEATPAAKDDTTKSLIESTQKLGLLNEQNVQLHVALKKAKDMIFSQDKRIKELAASEKQTDFGEAVASLRHTLEKKEAELSRALQEVQDTRAAARREQRLIMSAWYELGLQFQRRTNSVAAPVSWLAQQRQNLTQQSRRI
ncbi:hypothetical protein HDU91_001311, partial [Kappamyces sp. JEL0680]